MVLGLIVACSVLVVLAIMAAVGYFIDSSVPEGDDEVVSV